MAGAKLDLGAALKRLDAAVKAGDATVAKSLRRGATTAALTKLARTVGQVPPELEVLFRWHDGQSGPKAIGPSTNEQLLSVADVAAAWTFLEKKKMARKPWRPSWLPVMGNGAGDHVVYDRTNGQLVRYYHDDKMRPKEAASLTRWALDVAAGWENAAKSTATIIAPDGWSPVALPSSKDLAKKPDGTAYLFRATEAALGKGVFFHVFWKQAKDLWFQATNTTLERAWTSISNNLLPFQATPDRGMTYCLSKEKVFRDGEDAPYAGLFEQRFEKPPFPPKK